MYASLIILWRTTVSASQGYTKFYPQLAAFIFYYGYAFELSSHSVSNEPFFFILESFKKPRNDCNSHYVSSEPWRASKHYKTADTWIRIEWQSIPKWNGISMQPTDIFPLLMYHFSVAVSMQFHLPKIDTNEKTNFLKHCSWSAIPQANHTQSMPSLWCLSIGEAHTFHITIINTTGTRKRFSLM